MKYTLVFDMPEDREEHQRAVRASDAWIALHDVDQICRAVMKHGHNYKTVEEFAQDIRNLVHSRGELL